MINFLRKICIERVLKAGFNDKELLEKVYSTICEEYKTKSKLWDYDRIDELIKVYTANPEEKEEQNV